MGAQSLETAIQRAGSPVELLRHSTVRPHTFPVKPEFTNWRSEQRAWRTSCALLDQSHHMTDLYLSGPDAPRLLSDFGVNTFANFTPGKAKQYVAVNADGHIIGDAILFHLEDGLFDLVGHPTVPNWLQYNAEAGGYDVTIERDENSADRPSGPPTVYRYELQGPTAKPLVERLTGRPLPAVKFFHMTEFTIAAIGCGRCGTAWRAGPASNCSGRGMRVTTYSPRSWRQVRNSVSCGLEPRPIRRPTWNRAGSRRRCRPSSVPS